MRSEWCNFTRVVPQGSILGPLQFTLFVDDQPNVMEKCTVNLFADDTSIYTSDSDPRRVSNTFDKDLCRVANWIVASGLKINVAKTQLIVLSK